MTAYIRHNDNPERKIVEAVWMIDDHLPAINNLCVIEMEVSGLELQHMAQLLHGLIRPPKHDKVLWEGELARLIWGLIGGKHR